MMKNREICKMTLRVFTKNDAGISPIVFALAGAMMAILLIVVLNNSGTSVSDIWRGGTSVFIGAQGDSPEPISAGLQTQQLRRQNQPTNSSIISAEFRVPVLTEAKILNTAGAASEFSLDGGRTWHNRAFVRPNARIRMRLTTGALAQTHYTAYLQDNGQNLAHFEVVTAR